jgi:hypothetical protein
VTRRGFAVYCLVDFRMIPITRIIKVLIVEVCNISSKRTAAGRKRYLSRYWRGR